MHFIWVYIGSSGLSNCQWIWFEPPLNNRFLVFLLYINNILAVIYVQMNKFLKLINHPEINCRMLITISQIISFMIFPSSGVFFCSWPGSDSGNIRENILCKMGWRVTVRYSIIVMRISTATVGKLGIILDVVPTLFHWELSVRFKWELDPSAVLTECLFLRIVIPWRDFFFLEEVPIGSGSS